MKPLWLTLSLLLCALPLAAEPVRAETRITFSGTSTLHDFSGHGTSTVHRVEWTPLAEGGRLSAKSIAIQTKSLTTDHAKRDRNMAKMFDPSSHPLISGTLQNWRVHAPVDGTPATNTLLLEMNGHTARVPAKITSCLETGGTTRFRAEFDVSLKTFGLKRPSVLGLIRVGDTVHVQVDTLLSPLDSP